MTSRFEQALAYAARVHAGQKRKGTDVPFIAHILGVASISLEYGADEDESIGALLHDAVEDGAGLDQLEDIRKTFGGNVARIVEACSDSHTQPKPPWKERKERYIAHLKSADDSIRLVSASDKLYNVRAIVRDVKRHGEVVWTRFNSDKAGQLWYYRTVLEALKEGSGGRLGEILKDLELVVQQLEEL